MKSECIGIIAFVMLLAGCSGDRPLVYQSQNSSVINGIFVASQGVTTHGGVNTYDVCFNKAPESFKSPSPEYIFLLKELQPSVDEALGGDCVGVFLNIPSPKQEHGIFWAYFTKSDWKNYVHTLKSYNDNVSFISGITQIDGRKLDYRVLPGELGVELLGTQLIK